MNKANIPPNAFFMLFPNIIIIFVGNEFYPHPYIYQFRVYICTLGGVGVNFISDVNGR
jgi:hypothetical protein